ncbi:hypothetical protein BT69DRAFT_1303313, partial [Atractiella rhizophila]
EQTETEANLAAEEEAPFESRAVDSEVEVDMSLATERPKAKYVPPPFKLPTGYNPISPTTKPLPYHEAALLFQHRYHPLGWHHSAMATIVASLEGDIFPPKQRETVPDLEGLHSLEIEKEDLDLSHAAPPLREGVDFTKNPPFYSRTVNWTTEGENSQNVESLKTALQTYNAIHRLWWGAKTLEKTDDVSNQSARFYRNFYKESRGESGCQEVVDEIAEERGIDLEAAEAYQADVEKTMKRLRNGARRGKGFVEMESAEVERQWAEWWRTTEGSEESTSATQGMLRAAKPRVLQVLLAQKDSALKAVKEGFSNTQTMRGEAIAEILNREEYVSLLLSSRGPNQNLRFNKFSALLIWNKIFESYNSHIRAGGGMTVEEFYGLKGAEEEGRMSLHSIWTSDLRAQLPTVTLSPSRAYATERAGLKDLIGN